MNTKKMRHLKILSVLATASTVWGCGEASEAQTPSGACLGKCDAHDGRSLGPPELSEDRARELANKTVIVQSVLNDAECEWLYDGGGKVAKTYFEDGIEWLWFTQNTGDVADLCVHYSTEQQLLAVKTRGNESWRGCLQPYDDQIAIFECDHNVIEQRWKIRKSSTKGDRGTGLMFESVARPGMCMHDTNWGSFWGGKVLRECDDTDSQELFGFTPLLLGGFFGPTVQCFTSTSDCATIPPHEEMPKEFTANMPCTRLKNVAKNQPAPLVTGTVADSDRELDTGSCFFYSMSTNELHVSDASGHGEQKQCLRATRSFGPTELGPCDPQSRADDWIVRQGDSGPSNVMFESVEFPDQCWTAKSSAWGELAFCGDSGSRDQWELHKKKLDTATTASWNSDTYRVIPDGDGHIVAQMAPRLVERAERGEHWPDVDPFTDDGEDFRNNDDNRHFLTTTIARLLPLQFGQVRIYFLNVGQGGIAIIDGHNWRHPYIFDGGTIEGHNPRVMQRPEAIHLAQQIINGRSPIVIVSHPDRDHYNLIPEIFRTGALVPEAVYLGGTELDRYRQDDFDHWAHSELADGTDVVEYIRVADDGTTEGLQAVGASAGATVSVENPLATPLLNDGGAAATQPPPRAVFEFIASLPNAVDPETGAPDINARSLTMNLRVGEHFAATFLGDATGQTQDAVERAFGQRDRLRSGGVLQASHHGADTHGSNSEVFGAFMRPLSVVFQAGSTNFGHPRAQAAAAYENSVVQIGLPHRVWYWSADRENRANSVLLDGTSTLSMYSTMETGSVVYTVTAPGAMGRDPINSTDRALNDGAMTWVDVYLGGAYDRDAVRHDIQTILDNCHHVGDPPFFRPWE